MDLSTLDAVLRGAAFAVAAATAAAVLARLPAAPAARLAAFCLGGIAAFVVASAPRHPGDAGPAVFAFDAWCLATPAAVWALAAVLFRDGFALRAGHWAAAGVLVTLTFAGNWGRVGRGPLAADPGLAHALLLAGRVASLALLAGACALAAASWRSDLVEARRRTRLVFIVAIAAVFVALAASEFVVGPRGAGAQARIAGLAALALVATGVLVALARGALDEVLAPAPAPAARPPALVGAPGGARPARPLALVRTQAADAALARRTVEAMETGALWKRDGLTVAGLAAELGTQEHLLRRAINRHLGYRNFNDFLHDWRLRDAAHRLATPAHDALPVLSIALDCGYGSIGPFNRAFKARFGVTPTQYRALRRSETLPASGIGQQSG